MAIGAAITAVAVLFMMSDRVMVTTINRVSTTQGAAPSVTSTIAWATTAVPPLASSAVPIGIIEPSRTMTGHSIDS